MISSNLIEEYLIYTRKCIKELDTNFNELNNNPGNIGIYIENIKVITHDIKGMGGSFGYDLMSEVGTSLYSYIRLLPSANVANTSIIEKHISALKYIIENNIKKKDELSDPQLLEGLNRPN